MQKPVSSEDQVWVTVKQTIQTRPYESATIEMGTSQTVTNSEAAEEVRKALCEKLMDEVVEFSEDLKSATRHYRRTKNNDD